MTKDITELMRERYKVIAPMPFGKFMVGDILMHLKVITKLDQKEGELIWRVVGGRFGGQSVGIPMIKDPETYPHLFKKLEWWEDRKPEEMPEYVRYGYFPYEEEDWAVVHVDGTELWHSFEKDGYFGLRYKKSQGGMFIGEGAPSFYPAAPEQYTQYINTK